MQNYIYLAFPTLTMHETQFDKFQCTYVPILDAARERHYIMRYVVTRAIPESKQFSYT